MMISYYVAAIFATIYYIMLAPELCQALGHSFFYSTGRFSRLLAAFAESLQGFMDATLLFAIAMLVAAVSRYARVVQHPDDSYSLFQLLDCVFLSTLAVFPGLVLQSLSHELRRRRIRLFLWLLVLAFAAAVDALYNARFLSIFHSDAALVGFASRDAEAAQAIWLAQCQDERLLNTLLAALKAAHVFMILNCCWWAYYVFASLGGSRYRRVFERREVFWRWWGRARLWMRLGNGLVCLVVMWVLLGTFTLYRHDVSHRAGGTDVDNEWTLGQILALVQWFPVGLDLVVVLMCELDIVVPIFSSLRVGVADVVLWCGIKLIPPCPDGAKEGLTGKMSRKYKVVDRSKEDLLRDEEIGYDEYEQADGHDKNRADEKQSSRTQSWPRPLERSESWLDA